ncbi:MAG: SpoIIE family protein phosphatase [Bdellovibrionota bacterium]
MIDGLGHGAEAAEAAQTAIQLLEQHFAEPPSSLLRLCHEGLRATRGVAMSLASYNVGDSTLTWCGIGNVEGRLGKSTLLLKNGIVGSNFSPPRISTLPVAPEDTLIFTTDGIRPEFTSILDQALAPKDLAESILAEYSKGTDDALVLVARFVRGPR